MRERNPLESASRPIGRRVQSALESLRNTSSAPSAAKPTSVACTSMAPPRGTVALPGSTVTSRFGTAASAVDQGTNRSRAPSRNGRRTQHEQQRRPRPPVRPATARRAPCAAAPASRVPAADGWPPSRGSSGAPTTMPTRAPPQDDALPAPPSAAPAATAGACSSTYSAKRSSVARRSSGTIEPAHDRPRDERIPDEARDEQHPGAVGVGAAEHPQDRDGRQHREDDGDDDPDERLEQDALAPLAPQRAQRGEQLAIWTHRMLLSGRTGSGDTGRGRLAMARQPRVAMIVSPTSARATMINNRAPRVLATLELGGGWCRRVSRRRRRRLAHPQQQLLRVDRREVGLARRHVHRRQRFRGARHAAGERRIQPGIRERHRADPASRPWDAAASRPACARPDPCRLSGNDQLSAVVRHSGTASRPDVCSSNCRTKGRNAGCSGKSPLCASSGMAQHDHVARADAALEHRREAVVESRQHVGVARRHRVAA